MNIDYSSVITIDGPSGSGKSTIARSLAKELDYAYLETGAMYRAVTYFIIERGIQLADLSNPLVVKNIFSKFSYMVSLSADDDSIWLNGRDVTLALRSREVTNFVSPVSAVGQIRENLVSMQRTFAKNSLQRSSEKTHRSGIIVEGRDIGTVVFPQARWKFFLTADLGVRAQRRALQLSPPDGNVAEVEIAEVIAELKKRDEYDSMRKISPLKPAPDALIIDIGRDDIAGAIAKLRFHLKSTEVCYADNS